MKDRALTRILLLAAPFVLVVTTCLGGVRMEDLGSPRPLPSNTCVVVGFLGGRDDWDDTTKGVRQLALKLRSPADGIYAETFENRRLDVALEFIDEAIGEIDQPGATRVVVYGQSLGGWATIGLARALAMRRVPVELTLQIDSVGANDGEVPPNVRYAANLYQDDGWVIAGEQPIRAADPNRTEVLGNFEFDYDRPPGSFIDVADLPWWKTLFRVAHARMDRDPRVWELAESFIRSACSGSLGETAALL